MRLTNTMECRSFGTLPWLWSPNDDNDEDRVKVPLKLASEGHRRLGGERSLLNPSSVVFSKCTMHGHLHTVLLSRRPALVAWGRRRISIPEEVWLLKCF
ncbi:hypothetical protein NC651_034567 [Populus alba x Populus x berolinensis]|nr:hypothetical protein NC651_034567 [Populus alba x Populus x berolinensis]